MVREHPLRGVLQEWQGRGLCDELALELLCPAEMGTYVAARLDGEVTAGHETADLQAARALLERLS